MGQPEVLHSYKHICVCLRVDISMISMVMCDASDRTTSEL